METRKKASESTSTPSEADLLEMQKQLKSRERRVNDEVAKLQSQQVDFENTKKELEMQNSANKDLLDQLSAMHREIETLRKSEYVSFQPTTSRETKEIFPQASTSRDTVPEIVEIETHAEIQPTNFTLREAVGAVPTFDGQNISVFNFIRACKRSKDLIPPHFETTLTRLITNRLKGRAYLAVEDEGCNTISQLCDTLRDAFGPIKSIDHYRAELTNIYQRQNEHILDYIGRVKDIRVAINDCERCKKPSPPHPNLNEIDSLTLRCFRDGLIPEIRHQMPFEQLPNLSDAYSLAKELFKRYEKDRERYNNRPFSNQQTFRKSSQPLPASPEFCTKCQRPGHSRDNCWVKNPQRNQWSNQDNNFTNSRPESFRNTNHNREKKICKYCKNPGHEIHECRKRQYNNSRQQPGNAQTLSVQAGQTREATLTAQPAKTFTIEQSSRSPQSN